MPADIRKPEKKPQLIITDELEHLADQSGMRIEYVSGLPVWEASAVFSHQKKTLEIQMSLMRHASESGCACLPIADTTILFPDGSIKRPDIAVYCTEPSDPDSATTELPEAVIEIISKGYEKKDLEVSLPFYLAQKIADIVIFDPATNKVSHYHNDQISHYSSPVELTFACGCRAVV